MPRAALAAQELVAIQQRDDLLDRPRLVVVKVDEGETLGLLRVLGNDDTDEVNLDTKSIEAARMSASVAR